MEKAMEITYCNSPILAVKEFPMATRILTENILRDDRLDLKSNYSALECYKKYDDQSYASEGMIDHPMHYTTSMWKESLRLYLSSYYFPEKFVDSIKTDIVLMSCNSNFYDYPFIVELLNRGIKVVLGGTNFMFWRTPEFVTNLLLDMGVKEKYIKNFIIVEGLVDLTTDLYKIIKEWKHCKITENDFSTVWDCEIDYFQFILNSVCSILNLDMKSDKVSENYNNVIFLTNNLCWWGKCAFCGFTLQPEMDFNRNASPEKIASNIINTMKRFKSNRIYFCNDYFIFSKKHKNMLEIINANGDYRINCFTGIQMLNREDYLENINRYNFKYLKVGLEAGTDFALNRLNKGYTVSKVDETISKMKRILDKDVEVTFNSIVDSPQTSKGQIIENYNNIIRWRNELRDAGIKSNVVANSFAIIDGINEDRCVDNNYIRLCGIDEAESGRIKIFRELRKVFGEVIDLKSYDHYMPFNRYDKDGKMLLSDIEILPIDTIKNLYYTQWGWG